MEQAIYLKRDELALVFGKSVRTIDYWTAKKLIHKDGRTAGTGQYNLRQCLVSIYGEDRGQIVFNEYLKSLEG